MTDREYPHQDGDVTVLGPEIFASADGKVICWKGVNYVPQPKLERAEAAITRVIAALQPYDKPIYGDRSRGFQMGWDAALQAIRAALDEPTNPPAEATEQEKTTRVLAALHRSAEEDVTRVIDLYERWVKAGPPPLGTSMARWWDTRLVELRDAILPPKQADLPDRKTCAPHAEGAECPCVTGCGCCKVEGAVCDVYQPPTTAEDSGLCARCGMYDYRHAAPAEQQQDHLAGVLAEILLAFHPVSSHNGVRIGWTAPHPIHPDDYQRWTAALPKGQPGA